ncbi:hypothetical protein AVEN_76512-1 [Araneus ventricosus]|uniref:Uncharacterized protein n=1 Tax=Araneus ventricosus TaxID=182803 RepID=A0A4Y2CFE0_ARAVE|nr:hypothetical protein AVEN_76512-1 [Araneus ventricosus]
MSSSSFNDILYTVRHGFHSFRTQMFGVVITKTISFFAWLSSPPYSHVSSQYSANFRWDLLLETDQANPKLLISFPERNLWSMVKRRASRMDCSTKRRMIGNVINVWFRDDHVKHLCSKLVESKPNRVQDVIKARGRQIFF